jgi:hypothetical protein
MVVGTQEPLATPEPPATQDPPATRHMVAMLDPRATQDPPAMPGPLAMPGLQAMPDPQAIPRPQAIRTLVTRPLPATRRLLAVQGPWGIRLPPATQLLLATLPLRVMPHQPEEDAASRSAGFLTMGRFPIGP